MEIKEKENPIQVAILRYNDLSGLAIDKKMALAQHYFDTSLCELETAKKLYTIHKGICNVIKHPAYISSINFLVYNFYVFLLLYSDLKGSWNNFRDIIKDISHLLWNSGYGPLAYSLFTPVINNKNWNSYYSEDPGRKKHNDEYHLREKYNETVCPECGMVVSSINIKRHINSRTCKKLVNINLNSTLA